jgi:hypothetical protein
MKSRFIEILLFLIIGLQGPGALAAVSQLRAGCPDAAQSRHAAPHPCCPSQGANTHCCPDASLGTAPGSTPPRLIVWHGRTAEARCTPPLLFLSRDEAPLIRPPIR